VNKDGPFIVSRKWNWRAKSALRSTNRKNGINMISHGVSEHQDDAVSSKEHLADEAVLVHGLGLLLALARLGDLRPHFL